MSAYPFLLFVVGGVGVIGYHAYALLSAFFCRVFSKRLVLLLSLKKIMKCTKRQFCDKVKKKLRLDVQAPS